MKFLLKTFTFIFILSSIVACKPKGEKASTSEAGTAVKTTGTEYTVDNTTSVVNWEGSKITGKHNGTVNVSNGILTLKDGKLSAGNFTLDMNTITSLDLEGDMKAYLEAHLKGTAEGKEVDFFDVSKYPTAKFEITKATTLQNDDNANYIVSGNLTLKDVTKQVSFRANVIENQGVVNVTTPDFNIDRTEWGIKYGSAKFFDGLKDKAVNDNIVLSINLSAKK